MGALGEINDPYSEDDDDSREPVRQFMYSISRSSNLPILSTYAARDVSSMIFSITFICQAVWILVIKLAPTYYRKLNRLLIETARELPLWRKGKEV